MKTLYLVRHGETDWNKARRWQGRTDIPLNDTGRKQAKEAQNLIREVDFDICLSSPLERAQETAKILTDGKNVVVEELLNERNYGTFEGKANSWDIVEKLWCLEPLYEGEGVESLQELLDRTERFLQMIRESEYENILAVSHGGTLKAIHYGLIGYTPKTNFLDWHVGNCEVVKVEL